VKRGLSEGERVVTRGNFKLDAELQIRAKPSMMTPQTGGDAAGGAPARHGTPPADAIAPEFASQLGGVIDRYLDMQAALAQDDVEAAAAAAGKAVEALGDVDMKRLTGDTHMDWMQHAGDLKALLNDAAAAGTLEAARSEFALLSEEVAAVLDRFGVPGGTLYKAWCPMAFENRGAAWIQDTEEIHNPYFGEMMLRCGEIREVLQ